MSLADFKQRANQYEKLMRLDKPIGILLLLWPTLWGVWMASNGAPHWQILMIFVIGTVVMRSVGCVINDLADAKYDRHVARTRDRPLAAGTIKPVEALILVFVLLLVAFALVLFLNRLTILLSIPALLLAVTYPFTKRFFALPQAYLGLAFGFGIPMAFATYEQQVPLLAWVLLAANVFWALAYDTAYAMVDREDDLKIGIRTSAITFGRFDVVAIMLCYVCMFVILLWVGRYELARWPYYVGLAVAALIAASFLPALRSRDPARCFKVFLRNSWVGAAIFAGLLGHYAIRNDGVLLRHL